MARRKKNTLWLRSRIQHPIRYCQVVAAEERKLRRILRDNPNYSDSTRVRSRVRRARWSVTREYPGLAPSVSEPQETEDRGQDSEEEYESDDSYDGIVSRRNLESERSVHEERNKREEEAWGKVRNKIVDQAKLHHRDRRHSLQVAMHTEKERIKIKVESVSKTCPLCRGSGSLLSEFDRRKVTILTMQFCHVISIPLVECARCNMHGPSGCGRFHVIPADIDAFPSTPDWPFDLFHALRDDKVVLYHMDLLTFLRDQIDFSPRLAVSSFAKGFKRTLMRNGCHVKISAEQMSKHLSRALHEYTIFDMTANDPYMYSSTHRDCPMECPACLGSQNYLIHISKTKVEKSGADMATFEPIASGSQLLLHSVYIDGHYGLPHMAKAGKSRQYDPPFSIKLLPDSEVQEFEEHYTSQSRANAVATCGSEFQADSMLKRRSQYHDRTGVVGAFCRHGSCLLMLNMTKGEKWSYASMLLERIAGQIGLPINLCVIRRKDGVWGMILQEREHIDADTGDFHREFGISCDKDILKEGKLKPGHRLKYYPTSEIMGVFACPPVRFPIHPTKIGQRVVVYGAGNSNKLSIPDGSCGVVNAVIEDGPRTSLMCTVAVQEEYPSMETTQIDVKLKYTRFLLLENEQYVSHQPSDYDYANIPRRIIYKFENLTFCEIKKLFETAEKSRLVHKCSKGNESLVPGDDTLDILERKRKEAGHQDYVAWLASCVHSDPFFGKTCERRANERSETYVALQKPTETIAVLTCSRGQQKAVPATSKQGKKVNCEYRTRLTKFRYEDAIYAEALQTHTNHEPGSGDYHEPETPRLKRALDDLYDLFSNLQRLSTLSS
eukprot:jgi/Picre1/33570/NNA_008891.t1